MVKEATCEKAAVLARVREGGDSWLVGILVSHSIYKLPYRFLPFHASHSPGQVPVFQLLDLECVPPKSCVGTVSSRATALTRGPL